MFHSVSLFSQVSLARGSRALPSVLFFLKIWVNMKLLMSKGEIKPLCNIALKTIAHLQTLTRTRGGGGGGVGVQRVRVNPLF